MNKVAAIILVLGLVFAGTMGLADEIHDTLSSMLYYMGNVSVSDSVLYSIVDTLAVNGVYIISDSESVAVEYYDGSTVRQYGYIEDNDNGTEAIAATIIYAIEAANVMPESYIYFYINYDSKTIGFYGTDIDESELSERVYNDLESFVTYILNS